jgi:hypothetical protein
MCSGVLIGNLCKREKIVIYNILVCLEITERILEFLREYVLHIK